MMDLVHQFVYSIVLYLLARNESFHEISASTITCTTKTEKYFSENFVNLYSNKNIY